MIITYPYLNVKLIEKYEFFLVYFVLDCTNKKGGFY